MKSTIKEITTVEEAVKLHQKVISEFIKEATETLNTRHSFAYSTEVSGMDGEQVTSIAFCNKKYIAHGKVLSDALYERVVMPCEWLALRWKQEFRLRHKPIRENGVQRTTLLSVTMYPFNRGYFAEVNKIILSECEQMCKERNAGVMKTAVFG